MPISKWLKLGLILGVLIIVIVALLLIIPFGPSCPSTKLTFIEEKNITLDPEQGSTWSIPVFDGTNIVVSCESRWNITLRKYDLDLNPIGPAVEVVNNTDAGNQYISDHKHIFQNGYHYILFAAWNDTVTWGNGSLFLIQLDSDFNRVNFTCVAWNDPPVNDMLLVGDGINVYAGKFLPSDIPGAIHKIRKYDTNLNWLANYSEGIGDTTHVNGGATIFYDNKFYMVAPNKIGPGANSLYYLIIYDLDWNAVETPKIILNVPNKLGLINGLSVFEQRFIIHYCFGPYEANPIARAVYDCNWNLLQNETVYSWGEGDNTTGHHAPHTIIVGDTLYLGYTNQTPSFNGGLAKFQVSSSI